MSPGQMSKSRVEAPSAAAEPRLAPQPGLQNLRAKCGTRSSQQALTRPPAASFDHLVSATEKRGRHRQTEGLRGLEVDDQLVFGWRLDRKISWLLALEDAIDVACPTPVLIRVVRSIGDQAAAGDKVACEVKCGQVMPDGERSDKVAIKCRQRACCHNQAAIPRAREGRDAAFDLGRVAHVDWAHLHAK